MYLAAKDIKSPAPHTSALLEGAGAGALPHPPSLFGDIRAIFITATYCHVCGNVLVATCTFALVQKGTCGSHLRMRESISLKMATTQTVIEIWCENSSTVICLSVQV